MIHLMSKTRLFHRRSVYKELLHWICCRTAVLEHVSRSFPNLLIVYKPLVDMDTTVNIHIIAVGFAEGRTIICTDLC